MPVLGLRPSWPVQQIFPLSIAPGGRYLVDARGQPFLVHGDAAWSLVAQLTNLQIDQYLASRAARGVNLVLFNAPEAYYTSQSPTYNNVDGIAPFTTMSPVAWTSPVEAYWQRVDYAVNRAKALNIACIINPCYLGSSTTDGWQDEIASISDANMQTYGAWLANRYTQRNVIWSMGGDKDSPTGTLDKQWNIVTGMRTVRTTDIIMAHPLADTTADDAYTYWSSYTGFNLNAIYGWEANSTYLYDMCSQAYARSMPFLGFEFQYEQENSVTAQQVRKQSYAAILGGACGQLFGNSPIWHFESPNRPFAYTGTWQSNLDSTGSAQQQYVKQLFTAFSWWLLQPKTDTSLVTSSLSTGTTRLYPARASDGSFAMIYVPSSQTVTIDKTALTVNPLKIRLYDPTAGTYSTHTASTANTGTASVATGGERVIVLDAV